MKMFLTVLSYRADRIFIGKISKGHIIPDKKNVDEVTVFFSVHSDGGLYLYKISRKYSRWYQSYRETRFP